MKKKIICTVCAFIFLLAVIPYFSVCAASGPTIQTTLTDNLIQKGSKKTFDVWAKNSAGKKISSTVTFNGTKLSPTWDDNEKASYTLTFTKEGNNTVVVSATSDGGRRRQYTYNIIYKKVKDGEPIGKAVWSIEAFTIGCGYLVYPTQIDIYDGETSAEQLMRLINNNGFVGYYGGTVKDAFYLGYIADGTSSLQKYNGYQKSTTPKNPKKMNLKVSVPSTLIPHLNHSMTFFDEHDYKKNWNGYLGEFVITNGSGWMYCVNNVFPNVSFSDTYLSDGDVVRVQFTLGYGADIGGFSVMGSKNPATGTQPTAGYYQTANKDELTKLISHAISQNYFSAANVKQACQQALTVAEALEASQEAVNTAAKVLSAAISNPVKETTSSHTTIHSKTTTKAPDTNYTVTTKASTTPDTSVSYTKKPESSKASSDTKNSTKPITTKNRHTENTKESTANSTIADKEKHTSSASQSAVANTSQISTNPYTKNSIENISESTGVTTIAATDNAQAVMQGSLFQHTTEDITNVSEDESTLIAVNELTTDEKLQPTDGTNRVWIASFCVIIVAFSGAGCYVYYKRKNQHKGNEINE